MNVSNRAIHKMNQEEVSHLVEKRSDRGWISQGLPMYIRTRVLQGKVIFCRDEEKLYEVAIQTMKEFEDYKKIYDEYLRGVARG